MIQGHIPSPLWVCFETRMKHSRLMLLAVLAGCYVSEAGKLIASSRVEILFRRMSVHRSRSRMLMPLLRVHHASLGDKRANTSVRWLHVRGGSQPLRHCLTVACSRTRYLQTPQSLVALKTPMAVPNSAHSRSQLAAAPPNQPRPGDPESHPGTSGLAQPCCAIHIPCRLRVYKRALTQFDC